MADVGQRAVEGDAIADVDVEPVLPVGLVHPVRVSQREGLALLPVTWVKHTHTQSHTHRPAFNASVLPKNCKPKLAELRGVLWFFCLRSPGGSGKLPKGSSWNGN